MKNKTVRCFQFIWLALLTSLFNTHQVSGQGFPLKFSIAGLGDRMVYLSSYYFDREYTIDSSLTDNRGQVEFIFNPSSHDGMYRIRVSDDLGLDFIFSHEPVEIRTDSRFSPDSTVVVLSGENQLLYDYIRTRAYYEDRLQPLVPLLNYYPPDTFYRRVEDHARRLDEEYRTYLEGFFESHSGTIASRIVRFNQLQKIDPGSMPAGQREYFRSHYFDDSGFTDTILLYTPLLPGKLISYLSLCVMPNQPREAQESAFIICVDSLMSFTQGKKELREDVVNYLVDGFQAYGFEGVLTYLVENYVLGQSCVSEKEETRLQQRIQGFQELAIGRKAPDFRTTDMNGAPVHLAEMPGKYRLLFFWSGECPHCASLIRPLEELAAKYKDKLGIIGISVDTDEKIWRDAISEYNIPWANVADLKGWDGPIARDYHIYATPTLFLVDHELTIISKPNSIAELNAVLGSP